MNDDADTQVLVWRYGARKGVSIPPEVEEQLHLAHELREHLVELAYERERAIAALWARHPKVAAAERAVDKAQARLYKLLERASEERLQSRRRSIPIELREEIADARQARREAKAIAREAKNRAYATVAPHVHEIRAAERAERKAAYGEFVTRGLYWATFNNVARKHIVADRRIAQARKQGRRARLRHHEYDKTGRIAVQLQRESHEPERTAKLLCTPESPWWGMLRMPEVAATHPDEWAGLSRAEQRRNGRAAIAVRAGSRQDRSPVLWEIPVQIHRPLPDEAEVLGAEVVVTRTATDRHVSVNLTVRKRAAVPIAGPAVAVDIGWRSMRDGSLRVAYWRGSAPALQPLRVPPHLAEVLRVHASGREGEVRIPASWRELDERIAKIRSRRDKSLERIKETTAAYLERRPKLAHTLEVAPEDIRRWRSPARIVALGAQLADIAKADELLRELEAWERQHRRVWRWEANERDQLLARRRDAYKAVSALLIRSWPHALLVSRFVSNVTRRPAREEADAFQDERSRGQARLAAPAELAEAIRNATASRGGSVTELDPTLATRRHHVCGEELPREVRATKATVECPHCGMTLDQDANAVANMVGEWSGMRMQDGQFRSMLSSPHPRPRGGPKSATRSPTVSSRPDR